jgi:hypothetical protein
MENIILLLLIYTKNNASKTGQKFREENAKSN